MEDKIEVGEYVRTENGVIAKCEYFDKKSNSYWFDKVVDENYGEAIDFINKNEVSNIKHFKNEIDLIEVGDIIVYFSNSSGIYIKCEVNYACSKQEDFKSGRGYVSTIVDDLIRAEDIRDIVTHEQFESVKYNF